MSDLELYNEEVIRRDKYKNVFDDAFVAMFNHKANQINLNAVEKGWWEGKRNDGEMIALMHSELSECLEALRYGNPPDSHIPEFKGSEAELADVVIRIMDYSAAKGL